MKWLEIDAIPSIRSLAEEIQKLEDSKAEIQFEMPNSTLLQTDEQLFGHIVANLISNALKYSPDAKPILIRVEKQETALVCAVTDQGIGIHPDDQARLFELFYRGRNVGKIRGTGIGLAIVKHCVDALGGQIEYQSELGVGTTFTATIPLKRDSRR
jgi:signal transduction histidine kinase